MDVVIGNMRTSLEGGVRKMLTGQLGPKKASLALGAAEKTKDQSKVFKVSLSSLCKQDGQKVPYLVKDICNYITTYHLASEGIFRISASAANTARLREAFEQVCEEELPEGYSVTETTQVDGHTAANVLKQFLRQLPEPLIPSEVLQLCKDTKCLSDESFATDVRNGMDKWPTAHRHTLQYLLAFLQLVIQNTENRMNVTGLAVVFGPNTFKISSGQEGLVEQPIANKSFERLLLTSDIICENPQDQGYLDMTSPAPFKPVRSAPPVPIQARPLPPPPIPPHRSPDKIEVESKPSLPSRDSSLCSVLGIAENESVKSSEWTSDDENSDAQIALCVDRSLIDNTIRSTVRKHLFSSHPSKNEAWWDFDSQALLPSVTKGRNKGPKRRKPFHHRILDGDYSTEMPSNIDRVEHMTSSSELESSSDTSAPKSPKEIHSNCLILPVTTPDSGCLTAEEDTVVIDQEIVQESGDGDHYKEVHVPKLDLSDPFDESEPSFVMTEVVPPLDLSEVAPPEDIAPPQPLPRSSLANSVKPKRKRHKEKKSSISGSNSNVNHNMSEPITVPSVTIDFLQEPMSEVQKSPEASPSRWRDAWSTDEESHTLLASESFINNNQMRGILTEHNLEVAPSSPPQRDGFLEHHQLYHKHHQQHHKHHHHHHIVRPKMQNNLLATSEEKKLKKMTETLESIMASLDANRKACSRPEDLTLMTREQIAAEKVAMQRELLGYEGIHGRPSSKRERELMRGIYDRYRMVKRLMLDAMSPPFHATGSRHCDDVETANDYELLMGSSDVVDEFAGTKVVTLAPVGGKVRRGFDNEVQESHIAGDLQLSELLRQQRETTSSRKRLRRKLKDFEKEFQKQHDRKVLPADRVVMATEYSEYRDMKAKLRLLEALIEKHNSQQ